MSLSQALNQFAQNLGRYLTMHAVIDWSDPYRFGDSTGSFTAPDITVVFDKSGKIQRIDSTVGGFPPAR